MSEDIFDELPDWSRPQARRTWGCYEVLARSVGYKVKRLILEPGKSTSLQLHHHRAELWQLVEGDLMCAIEHSVMGDLRPVRLKNVGGIAIVPKGKKHRLWNDSDSPGVLIEIQTGICREEDIERFPT